MSATANFQPHPRFIELAARYLNVDLQTAANSCKPVPEADAIYFRVEENAKGALLMAKNGGVLYANLNIPYEVHVNAFKEGKRTNPNAFQPAQDVSPSNNISAPTWQERTRKPLNTLVPQPYEERGTATSAEQEWEERKRQLTQFPTGLNSQPQSVETPIVETYQEEEEEGESTALWKKIAVGVLGVLVAVLLAFTFLGGGEDSAQAQTAPEGSTSLGPVALTLPQGQEWGEVTDSAIGDDHEWQVSNSQGGIRVSQAEVNPDLTTDKIMDDLVSTLESQSGAQPERTTTQWREGYDYEAESLTFEQGQASVLVFKASKDTAVLVYAVGQKEMFEDGSIQKTLEETVYTGLVE